MKSFSSLSEEIDQRQLNDVEKFADRILAKFKVDIEFTKHFSDRVNDTRNKPAITVRDLVQVFQKIEKKKAVGIRSNPNSEAIIKDLQKDLNMPVVIKFDKNKGMFIVINKTIMRKKNFKSSNKVITTEERNYRKEYDNYHSSPEQIKRRTKRNEARRSLRGRKDLTDDKDVHHKDGDPLNNDKSNLSIVTQRYNRREPRLRDKNAEETKVNENSGGRRLVNRLKKKGLDLDKRAADRERQHRELVKKYAKEKQSTNEESSIDEASKIKIVKGDKTRMITKQELNTYKQMGWKVVNEEMNEATVEIQALDPKNSSLQRSLKRNKVNMTIVEKPKASNGNAFIVKLTGDTKGIKSVLKTQWDGEYYDDIEENKKMKDDPCWKDYEMVGTKKKNGKEVPNCVPKKNETKETKEEVEPISFFKLRESLRNPYK